MMAHSRSSRVMEGLLTRSLSNHSPLPTFQLVTFPDTSRSSYVRSEFIKSFNNLFSPLRPVYLRQHNVDLNLYARSFCNIFIILLFLYTKHLINFLNKEAQEQCRLEFNYIVLIAVGASFPHLSFTTVKIILRL